MNKVTVLLLSICLFLFSSCGSKAPENVRELMESEGWIFCKTVLTDSYIQSKDCDPYIFEDSGTFDLFMKENGDFRQFALTVPNSDNRSLEDYYKEEIPNISKQIAGSIILLKRVIILCEPTMQGVVQDVLV